MNMWGTQINSAKEFLPALKEAFKQKGPAIIGVPVDYSENMRLTEHLGKVSASNLMLKKILIFFIIFCFLSILTAKFVKFRL